MERFELERAGLRLVGERWGGTDTLGNVVLLHGGGQTRHSWGHTAARLAENGWTAIAFDLRGHGDSSWDPAGDYGLDAFVNDLLALVAELDRPPVLVGASLGGITALVAAGEHPDIARGVVLVDVVARLEPGGVARIQDFLTGYPDGFASLDEAAEAIASYNPVRRRPKNVEGLKKNLRLSPGGRWYWHWDPAFVLAGNEPHRHIEPRRLRAAARRLKVPTLLVRGAKSDVVSDSGIADMLELVPHAEYVAVSEAGHMVAGDDNDVFAGRLEAFLASLARQH
jgi:pimeloyl-ACP methyl ester carboxylesterase